MSCGAKEWGAKPRTTETPQDYASAAVKLTLHFDEGDLIPQMQKMTNILNEHKLNLKKITDKHDVIMRIYVQSNLAQMYFYLPAEIINKLSELSLSLEVSVLSDGEVL